MCAGVSPKNTVSRQPIDAFANNGVKPVYAFSCIQPVEETEAGHCRVTVRDVCPVSTMTDREAGT